MCNLYSVTKGQAAIIALTRAMRDTTGNLPPMPGVFPDYSAPIVRNGAGWHARVRRHAGACRRRSTRLCDPRRSGRTKLESKGQSRRFQALLRMEPDGGTTNIRNARSQHWKRWLGTCASLRRAFHLVQRIQQGRRAATSGSPSTRPAAGGVRRLSGRTGLRSARSRRARPPTICSAF